MPGIILMNEIIEGKKHAVKIRDSLRRQVEDLNETVNPPRLDVLIAGSNAASLYYARLIEKAASKEGMFAGIHHLKHPSTESVIKKIEELNSLRLCHGILVQLPLPGGVDREAVLSSINPLKDIDGQNPVNLGALLGRGEGFRPATARAVLKIIKLNGINLRGRKVVVVGRSTAVGLPAALMLVKEDAAVTVCHSKTIPLEEYTKEADILVVSAGRPQLIRARHVKKGASVIDVGTNEVNGKMVGDVKFSEVLKKASVSPVKGGVGALTMACLLENTFNAFKRNTYGNRA